MTKRYKIKYPGRNKEGFAIPLEYHGRIEGKIVEGAAEYARGFSETSGIISHEGIYLANSTAWIPALENNLLTFNLTAIIDSAWSVVSQGKRTLNMIKGNKRIVRYESSDPGDEIYLIAGKWTEYNRNTGNVLVQAELRKPDSELANKYLDATIGYLELYEKLIGPYPFSKFCLVENFWETGYGMPSFTLLGEKVIRFPFIINSSYPHELLHNYWGNSVYVDYDKGNWCEGLTAYLADHLFKEQQGQGLEYRRTTLQKFTDFVNENNDFPVMKFRSRNNSAEEAIGYGKTLMIFDMLRYSTGDELFVKSIGKFYLDNKFRYTSFDDLRKSFEEVTGKDLKSFFDQWLTRKGAPGIKLSDVKVTTENNKYKLDFTLLQSQKEEPFSIIVPVAFYLEGEENADIINVNFTSRKNYYSFAFDKRPTRLDIDPQFHVFRRLGRDEVPPAISQILGDKDVIIILPKTSPFLKEYNDLAEQWMQTAAVQGNTVNIIEDISLQELPDKGTWILGFENKFAAGLKVFENYAGYLSHDIYDRIGALEKSGTLVYVFPNPKNKMVTNGFLGSTNKNMISGLKRKIPHYGKYSYLGFEGDEAENKLKGEFPCLTSPLTSFPAYDGKVLKTTAKLRMEKALIY
jgi:aminopeptidase N